jgi:hypothetical protein
MISTEELILSLRYEKAKNEGCELTLDYNNVRAFNKKRCPYFYGVKEYGNVVSFELTLEGWEQLSKAYDNFFDSSNRLNVFENGTTTISQLTYNNREEEWEEYETLVLDKDKAKKYLDYMLAISPIRRNCDNITVGSYEELIEFAKKGDF